MPRFSSWLDDFRSLPRDCRVAWHFGGPAEVVLTLLERSVFRVAWGGRFLVVRAPMRLSADASPVGVLVERFGNDQLDRLAAVSTTPRMRLFRHLAALEGICVVATRDGQVIGYVWGLKAGPASSSRFLRSLPAGLPCVRTLFVARQERGRGVATAMLARLAECGEAEKVDAPACCALVRPGNRTSLRMIASVTGGDARVLGQLVQFKVFGWVGGWRLPAPDVTRHMLATQQATQ